MKNVIIDWNSIHPLNGSRSNGFEELCAQLARSERPTGSHFERKGTPDAGVECYATLNNGDEWAWQAKFFDTLGDSQWQQLDESVRTALEKHPRIVQYFVCVPLDLPDGRIPGRRSAKDRWNEHTQKWTQWSAARNMSVQFLFWGSSQLLERLANPKHAGRVRFWFGILRLNGDWFVTRLEEAVKTAGPRYTPEIHIDLPIAQELEGFGRTEQFFNGVKAHARDIRKELRDFLSTETKSTEPSLGNLASALRAHVETILDQLHLITVQPVGDLPFLQIADLLKSAEAGAENLEHALLERERKFDTESATTDSEHAAHLKENLFRQCRYALAALSSELRSTRGALVHAQNLSGSLMLLRGPVGTGKTHLLCDVALRRVASGLPTVLLMGQRFVSSEPPWTQALQHLDATNASAYEFIGALEAAAQAANCRALVIVDAINEGNGRIIWPPHLAAFIATVEQSPWIGLLVSVRSSYEDIVVPPEIRARATIVTHYGFTDREYEASRTFFSHYQIELPSTPLLTPEFRNPLFLKTICIGLNGKGERRLPRGFHGISAVFELYLEVINDRVALAIGGNPKDKMAHRALEALTNAMVQKDERWLVRAEAQDIVNQLLPGKVYQESIYRAMVAEGLLVEEVVVDHDSSRQEIAFLAYERLADHLTARALLKAHLNNSDPTSSFATGGPLAFLSDKEKFVTPGLLEAVCIQIAENTNRELGSLEPKILDQWRFGDAFRQSLIWRAPTAFSDETYELLNKVVETDRDMNEMLDVLLTVAILPEHPLNASFLHDRLQQDSMPKRDAWWSIYLHSSWGNHGAVDRLVDWAYSVTPTMSVDSDALDLCAITLGWMLTTSNRFLRDRATQSLVNLLSGRPHAVIRFISRFENVDDPYVMERVYAVSYGTAMQSHDPSAVAPLATYVYKQVFAHQTPPAHILLRDYARGIIERGLYLGSEMHVVVDHIRPPYKSDWPKIPTDEDIRPLLPDWSRGSYDSGDIAWARNTIGSSVMNGDFGRYVIGTNSSTTNWLSVPQTEPVWRSAASRLSELEREFSDEEISVWKKYRDAEDFASQLSFISGFLRRAAQSEITVTGEIQAAKDPKEDDGELSRAQRECDDLFAKVQSALTTEHAQRLNMILDARKTHGERAPRLDLRLVQRYVVWRVFDLGWTAEQFGYFDRFSRGSYGREASKAERIGKKYQWIAYHEILALISDRFQYREEFQEDVGDRAYDGPYQDWLRNIDPSCTLRSLRGGTTWDGHSPSWWAPSEYDQWEYPMNPREWVIGCDDLPKLEDLLQVRNSADSADWINLQGYFNWKQKAPADQDSTDVERREIWYICNGYLIPSDNADAFLTWAETVHFWGRWMPDPPEIYKMFLGEHCWSPASRYFQKTYFGDDGWTQPGYGCPVKVRTAAVEYRREGSGFDCSVDKAYTLRLPAPELIKGLSMKWKGPAADYVDASGQRVAFDPTAHDEGPSALLVHGQSLLEFLHREKLAICWAVLGEKRVTGAGLMPNDYSSVEMSGAYVLSKDGPKGFLKCSLPNPEGKDSESKLTALTTIRTAP